MLSQNTKHLLDEAKKLLAYKKLGIKTDFSVENTSIYLLKFKLEEHESMQLKLS